MIFLICLLSLGPLISIALYNLRHAPRLEQFEIGTAPDGAPPGVPESVSVLVPLVGDGDVSRLLSGLARSEYAEAEILFGGDADEATRDAVNAFVDARAERARVIELRERPEGWSAHNWAAHQLAQAARGEVLIFCTAGLSLSPRAVSRTLAARQALGVDCLGVMPRFLAGSWAERALVPFVREIPVAGLFLLKRQPALPVSPEWMAITRAAYGTTGGHAAVPLSPVAEGAIAHRARLHGKTATVLGTRDLSLRSARRWRAVWESLVDKLYLLAGGRESTLFGLGLWLVAAFILPWLGLVLPWSGAVAACLLLVVFRCLAAALFESPGFDTVAHPLGALVFPALMFDSYRRARRVFAPPKAIPSAPASEINTDGV